VPTVSRGPESACDRHGTNTPQLGVGWCLPCYEAGAFTLTLDPAHSECAVHSGLSDSQAAAVAAAVWSAPAQCPRLPRGRAARPPAAPYRRPGRLSRTARRALHRSAARALAYGRRRAAARLTARTYQPHPGWRHFIDTGWRVLTDQSETLRIVEDLVDAQDWRADKRTSWLAILRRLVYSMDWTTGLVTALTAQQLGHAGNRSPRTVSRVLAWARDTGLIVVVEHGASAQFLGTPHGRTPTYAFATSAPAPHSLTQCPAPPGPRQPQNSSSHRNTQLTFPVDENGNLPTPNVEIKPLNGTRLDPAAPAPTSWLVYRIPESASERNLATQCLVHHLGLDRRGVSRVPLWRTRALLRPWWDAGASPAGLLWAIHHHPDHPTHHRGDALRSAHDPLRVLGHRLRPWHGRLNQLPLAVTGIHGNYQNTPASAPAPGTTRRHPPPKNTDTSSPAQAEVRRAARAALDQHLRTLREQRTRRPANTGDDRNGSNASPRSESCQQRQKYCKWNH
jgi:hypothetical protein